LFRIILVSSYELTFGHVTNLTSSDFFGNLQDEGINFIKQIKPQSQRPFSKKTVVLKTVWLCGWNFKWFVKLMIPSGGVGINEDEIFSFILKSSKEFSNFAIAQRYTTICSSLKKNYGTV
jgi:hypothetical protein